MKNQQTETLRGKKCYNGSVLNAEMRERVQSANVHRAEGRTEYSKQHPQIGALATRRAIDGRRYPVELPLHPLPQAGAVAASLEIALPLSGSGPSIIGASVRLPDP